jgi:hypothetical protein
MDSYCSHMSVDCGNAFVGSWLEELAGYELLDCEDDTIFTSDANGCAAVLNCFDCILDLKIAAVGREDGVLEIVTRSY